MGKNKIPISLKAWFVIHFFADIVFAIGLIIFPEWILSFFGFNIENILVARFFGSSLVAIGTTSLIVRNASFEVYDSMLTLKLLFSGTTIVAILFSIFEGSPKSSWFFLAIFVCFFFVWGYYKRQLNINKN